MHEFELIRHYFNTGHTQRDDVIHGIGDDAAIVSIPPHHELAITTDTLVAGVHFPLEALAESIGHKALAVNLSDLAAMGATPAWVTLALTLPQAEEAWIQAFCQGFFTLAKRYQVQLIGGDLTRGPLSITVQAMGLLPAQQAILRSKAKPGDLIYVSGTVGDAGLALLYLQKKVQLSASVEQAVLDRLHRPQPRVDLGQALRGLAHAAIDISDGLVADLSHILEQSQVGARVYVDQLPLSQAMTHTLGHDAAIALALTAGDDYELCFTIPPENQADLEKALASLSCSCANIGEIREQPGLELCYQDGKIYHGPTQGYEHF